MLVDYVLVCLLILIVCAYVWHRVTEGRASQCGRRDRRHVDDRRSHRGARR